MGKEKKKLKIEGMMERTQVAAYLESLVAGLKDGALHIQAGQESAVLTPPTVVDFEFEVASKKDKEKLSIEISWKLGDKAAQQDVSISSTSPRLDVV